VTAPAIPSARAEYPKVSSAFAPATDGSAHMNNIENDIDKTENDIDFIIAPPSA
jgi:hypothetical protein